jgi:glycosyltransferase involved in cell wall biosynthesis
MAALPSIDVVIIGLNSAKTLPACIESVFDCAYPRERLNVFYADGGSADTSLSIAESYGARAIRVEALSPSPGRQRNAGWRNGSGEFVQFLDSDTIMDPEWLGKAILSFVPKVLGAVCGNRREMRPEGSVFNWIGDLEWNGKPGEVEAFGGDVLIPRSVLELTGGYDPDLIAGEDPELSYRIRESGLKILRLAEPMTKHDLAMRTVRQYWKRAFRSGHAFAEIHSRHRDFKAIEVKRIAVRTVPFLVGLAAVPFALVFPWLALVPLAGFAILIRPRLLLVGKFQDYLALGRGDARKYAWHASLVVIPQFFGMARFYCGRLLSRPLTNRRVLGASKKAAAK